MSQARVSNKIHICLALLIAASVLFLPFLPTEDGPAHLYYATVLSDLLHSGRTFAATYSIRGILPPYSFHWYLLVLLDSVFDPLLSERLVAALTIFWLCLGAWRLIRALSPNNSFACMLVLPLSAMWPFYMGFFNFMLATGTLLFLMGWWLDNEQKLNVARCFGVVLAVFVVASMHPVPALMFFLFAGLLLMIQALQTFRTASEVRPKDRVAAFFRTKAWVLITLFLSSSVLLWIGNVTDHRRVEAQLSDPSEIVQRVMGVITLKEISPLGFRQWDYTAALGATLALIFVLAFLAFNHSRNGSRFLAVAAMACSCFLLFLVVPGRMNGSVYFQSRFLCVFCFLMIALASGARLSRNLSLLASAVALVSAVVILGSQWRTNRAIITHLESVVDAPCVRPGSRVLSMEIGSVRRRLHELHYDPISDAFFYWSIRSKAVVANMLWMNLSFLPLKPASPAVPIVENYDAGQRMRAAIEGNAVTLPFQADALAIPRSVDAASVEDELVRKLQTIYGYKLLSNAQSDEILLARPDALCSPVGLSRTGPNKHL